MTTAQQAGIGDRRRWAVAMALALAAGAAHAGGRPMSDAELDAVHGRGAPLSALETVLLQDLHVRFQTMTPAGPVSGGAALRVEMGPTVGPATHVSVGGLSSSPLPPIQVSTRNAHLRISGDLDIALSALPKALRALEQNSLLPGALRGVAGGGAGWRLPGGAR